MKNLTDYFQSLELLEAGVPRETADYFFQKDNIYSEQGELIASNSPRVPCWSIGALWQYLFDHNCDMVFTFDTEQTTAELIDDLVNAAIMVRKRE